MQYTVYYWKDPDIMVKVFLENHKPTIESLVTTHTKLGTFDALDKEDLFHKMQAESMTPEVLEDVKAQKPSHTSMALGDVIQENSLYFISDVCGFARII